MTLKETVGELPRVPYGIRTAAGPDAAVPSPFPRTIGPNAMQYLKEVVDSGLTSNVVERFESAFAAELGVKHCIGTPGCTPALASLAAALPFGPGDEIIVSPITDYGTIQGLIKENYIPVFADTGPGSPNLSAATIEPLITDRTRAILTVHMTGTLCDMDPINQLADRHGLFVYEDVCQAVFGQYKGRLAGTLAQAAGFSFDAEKTMGSDLAGAVVTNDDELAERIRFMAYSRAAVSVPHFGREHREAGYAYRMPLSTAAITLAQLEIIRPQVTHRDRMIRLISELLSEIPGITPTPIPDYMDVYSCWMAGFSIDPAAFRCSAEEFGQQMLEAGVPGAGQGKYYLIPASCTFLGRDAAAGTYPYSMPPASRRYSYDLENYPNAVAFLENYVRWASFCEKYQPEDCYKIAKVVAAIADRNRL